MEKVACILYLRLVYTLLQPIVAKEDTVGVHAMRMQLCSATYAQQIFVGAIAPSECLIKGSLQKAGGLEERKSHRSQAVIFKANQ